MSVYLRKSYLINITTKFVFLYRPRAPSHALIPPRPHSPVPPGAGGHLVGSNYPAFLDHNQVEPTVITFPIQAPSDRLNVTSKLTTGGAINAVVAQREQRALANQLRKLDMQRTSPKLRCTWHCFCVALRALSGGLGKCALPRC